MAIKSKIVDTFFLDKLNMHKKNGDEVQNYFFLDKANVTTQKKTNTIEHSKPIS